MQEPDYDLTDDFSNLGASFGHSNNDIWVAPSRISHHRQYLAV
jgi:hypothetical protein